MRRGVFWPRVRKAIWRQAELLWLQDHASAGRIPLTRPERSELRELRRSCSAACMRRARWCWMSSESDRPLCDCRHWGENIFPYFDDGCHLGHS